MSAVSTLVVQLLSIYDLVSEDDTRLVRDEDHINALATDFERRRKENPDEHPVHTPLRVVRRNGKYLIVAGNNRYFAGRRAGLPHLPCIVLPDDLDVAGLFLEQVRDNRMHKGYTQMEDARNILRVMELRKCSQAVAGRLIGIPNAADVTKLLRVLKGYPEDLHPLIGEGDGKVPFTAAYELSRLPDEKRKRELTDKVVKGLLTRDAVKDAVARELDNTKATAPKAIKAQSPKGLVLHLPPLDGEALIAELTVVIEGIRNCARYALPLSALPRLLKT